MIRRKGKFIFEELICVPPPKHVVIMQKTSVDVAEKSAQAARRERPFSGVRRFAGAGTERGDYFGYERTGGLGDG